MMFEITVTRVFPATHSLRLPDGSYEPVHRHDWRVRVAVRSQGLDAMETVMDFHQLEGLVDSVIAPFHNRSLNDVEPFSGGRLNPSAERVAWWIGTQVAQQLPKGVSLVTARVTEAPGCEAAYRP